jgi:hypothetical protein
MPSALLAGKLALPVAQAVSNVKTREMKIAFNIAHTLLLIVVYTK